jgi:hypothetical protein
MILRLALFIFLLIPMFALPVQDEVTPATVLAFAQAHGYRDAIFEYFNCTAGGYNGYARVASGNPQWRKVAVAFLPYMDGCQTESMRDSLAESIVHAPAGVLGLVGSSTGLTIETVCFSQLWDTNEMDPRATRKHIRRIRSAMRTVQEPALRGRRDACMSYLGEIESRLNQKAPSGNGNPR